MTQETARELEGACENSIHTTKKHFIHSAVLQVLLAKLESKPSELSRTATPFG